MPAVTESTMVDSKGEVVTDFIDSVGTSSVSYTYTNTQTSLYIRNDSDVSITVTVNGSPTTVTRLSDTTITAEFTSFSIVAASDTAAFYARSLRGVPTNTTSTSQLNVISGTAASPSITAIADANTGIFFPASETIAFSTNGSERVRINTSGNVGIGTTSPTYKLHINESDTAAGSSSLVGLTSSSGGVFAIGVSDKSLANPIWNITTASSEQLAFLVGATEKMRITSAGNVGIGTTNPSYQLQLSTDSAAKPSTNTWTIASDERVKTVTGDYTKGLDAICALRPITYEYNGKAGFIVDGKENISIIAQEAIEHFPECVGTFNAKLEETDEQETELYNWNGHAITFALINAVKELTAKVEALEAQLNGN